MMRYGLLLLALVASGCGDDGPATYPVSGMITFNGQPIPEGSVAFVPKDGRTTPSATQIVEGSYALELSAGPHRVIVEASKFVGPKDREMGLRPRDQYIPDKYNLDSELSVEVKPNGKNQFNFDLTD